MIPILYNKTETDFTSNGLGRLADCISCTVTEERNGIYECQFKYPVTGEMFSEIQEGRIIAVIHDDEKDIQPFDIYAHSAPLNGVVTFYAHHISYRLGSIILKPMEASSCNEALYAIPNNTYNTCPFTFWTDKDVSSRWVNNVPSAVKAVLGGQQGSILDVYGKGEYKWDKFNVRLYVNRGNDNGVSIRYGVNMTDLNQDYDESSIYNAVVPYWINNENGTVITLANGIVARGRLPWTTSSGLNVTDGTGNIIYFDGNNRIVPVPMDLTEAFDEQPTEQQLEAEAMRRLNSSEAWLPSENITVKFVNLADTEEYKNVAALQRVSLCDKVSVYCGPLNVSAVKMQVIRVVYNVLAERYNEIELGKAKVSFSQTITAKVEEMTKDLPTMSTMQRAIDNATDQITGAKGGHLRDIYDANGNRQEMVVMDTEDIDTAVKVWRWNLGGLGYSGNGYDGPYTTAITQDGEIVADFITTGILNAAIVKAGILGDYAGKNYWNMETGEFSLSGDTLLDDTSVTDVLATVDATITNVDVEYAQNQSTTVAPISGWSTTAPTWQEGYYIWQRTGTTTSAGTTYSDATCISGKNGEDGATGIGVSAIIEQYYLSTSNVTQTDGTWSANQPAWVSGKYIWTRSQITWTNSTITYTSPVLAEAINGANSAASSAQSAVTTLDNSLNQQGVFNRLTNNGQTQGIYLNNGLLYINASYIHGGSLTLGGNNNTNGTLTIKDASNNIIGKWDKDGINVSKGTIQGPSITLGGNNNANGVLTVNGPSTDYTGIWDQYGIKVSGPNGSHKSMMNLASGRLDSYLDSIQIASYWGNLIATHNSKNLLLYANYPYSGSRIELYGDGSDAIYMGDSNGTVYVNGNFSVFGTKNRKVQTDQYADRLLYCYETPSPLFGDVGEGVISEDGLCYVTLDAIFAQTITTTQYQVFLQKYGDGDCWVSERKGAYFIVQGTPGMAFGWEIKAKQKDFDQRRLDKADEPFRPQTTDYGAEAAQYIEQLKKEREAA